jgi:hypothetical protein
VGALCALACVALLAPGAAEARRSRPPVVLMVFDEFPSTDLFGKHGRIDGRRFPNFARLAGDATWYRHATTASDTTFTAVPSILEGRVHRYRPGRPPRIGGNILSFLAGHGYRVHARAEARGVCQRRFCGRQHTTRYYLVRSRLARLNDFIDSIQPSKRPTIWFKHVLLPHLPWIYLPSGKQYIRGYRPPLRGINSARGVFDPGLENLSYQRHLFQVMALDRAVGRLIDHLKKTGLYNKALVVVVADHGISFRVGETDKRIVTRANVQGIAPVPLFIKRPRQTRGRVSDLFVRNSDVAPSIAHFLGLSLPWHTSGHPVTSRLVRRRHTVHVQSRLPGVSAIQLGVGSFVSRWRRRIRSTHGIFGIGSVPRAFAIGPARRVIGRQVTGLRIARAGRVRASVLGASEIRQVNRRSRFIPSLVSGYIRGGRGRHRRALAIVVNGRIVATGRSFYLRGSSRESYAVIVPDSSFQPGRNSVRVLAVGRRGKRLRFRALGRV